MNRIPVLALSLASALGLACAPDDATPGVDPSQPQLTRCSEPRSQACTREYVPVCGEHRDGSRTTGDNACTACADPTVVGHRPGGCE